MTNYFLLEDFDTNEISSNLSDFSVGFEAVETQKLLAYEAGYKAGWDDSSAASTSEHQRMSSNFLASLDDISFSYHEAREHVLRGVETLIKDLFGQVLPEVAKTSVAQIIWDQISDILGESSSHEVIIFVATGLHPEVRDLISSYSGFPLEVREEPTLAEGQLFLKSGDVERSIDLTSKVTEINRAIVEFFNSNHEVAKQHG